MSQQDKTATFQQTLTAIQQRWGSDALKRLESLSTPACLPGGIPMLDDLLGGGLPVGKVTELSGGPGSGMSGLALAWTAGIAAGGYAAALIDTPGTFDPEAAAGYGVDLAELVVARPASPAEALSMAEDLAAARLPLFITLDLTVKSPPPSLRKLAGLLAGSPGVVLVLRDGDALPLPGASIRLEARRVGWMALGESVRGMEVEVTLRKGINGAGAERVVVPLVFGIAP